MVRPLTPQRQSQQQQDSYSNQSTLCRKQDHGWKFRTTKVACDYNDLKQAYDLQEGRLHDALKEIRELKESKIAKDEMRLLARGIFFSQLRDVVDTTKDSFQDGFKNICGRINNKSDEWREENFPDYAELVAAIRVMSDDDDISRSDGTFISQSGVSQNKHARARNSDGGSRKSKSKGSVDDTDDDKGVQIIDSGLVTNEAHLLAGDASCGPTSGLFVQAIVGEDFETQLEEKTKDFNVFCVCLRNLAYHQSDYKGFCHLPRNKIQVPKGGHEKYFDEDCSWIVVPIMSLDQIIDWTPSHGGYWIMFIAGNLQQDDHEAYTNFFQASTSDKPNEHIYIKDRRERCTKKDIETALESLALFVKAFADLATGRGASKPAPDGLAGDFKQPVNIAQIRAKVPELAFAKEVTIPDPELKSYSESTHVVKLNVDHPDQSKRIDPMAIAAKGALNWMTQTDEKVIPGCSHRNLSGEMACGDDTESFESSYVSHTCTSSIRGMIAASSGSAFQFGPSDHPQTVAVVTLEKQGNGVGEGDGLEDDDLTQGSFDSQLEVDEEDDNYGLVLRSQCSQLGLQSEERSTTGTLDRETNLSRKLSH